jgi:hypothetical protein
MAISIIKNPIGSINNQQTTIQEAYGNIDSKLWQNKDSTTQQYAPLSLVAMINDTVSLFKFPYEPLIAISGSNNVIKRNVAKGGQLQGTIKERFSRGDYKISISGILLGDNEIGDYDYCFPTSLMSDLQSMLEAPTSLKVENAILNDKGILRIVIENYSFPFSKGENAQRFEIEAVSDFDYNLLIER